MSERKRILTDLSIQRVAAVDLPCQEPATSTILKRAFSEDQRATMAAKGEALPDGSYPIATKGDLKNAIQASGRAGHPAEVKAHITTRAKALGAVDQLPEEWNVADETGDEDEEGDDEMETAKVAFRDEVTKVAARDGIGRTAAMERVRSERPDLLKSISKSAAPASGGDDDADTIAARQKFNGRVRDIMTAKRVPRHHAMSLAASEDGGPCTAKRSPSRVGARVFLGGSPCAPMPRFSRRGRAYWQDRA